MTATPEERRRLESQARSLEEIEIDDEPTPEVRRAVVSETNEWRARHGIPPLIDEEEDPPEAGIYRRAKALGMVGEPRH